MSRRQGAKVMTANDLERGHVVFWMGGGWSDAAGDALVLPDGESQRAALEAASRDQRRAVGAYLADVADDGLTHFRERVRTTGPTIAYAGRPARGKA